MMRSIHYNLFRILFIMITAVAMYCKIQGYLITSIFLLVLGIFYMTSEVAHMYLNTMYEDEEDDEI